MSLQVHTELKDDDDEKREILLDTTKQDDDPLLSDEPRKATKGVYFSRVTKPINWLHHMHFVRFMSLALALIQVSMASAFDGLLCQNPCASVLIYLMHFAWLFGSIVFWIGALVISGKAGANYSIIYSVLSFISTIIFLVMFFRAYEGKNKREKMKITNIIFLSVSVVSLIGSGFILVIHQFSLFPRFAGYEYDE